MCEVVDRLPRSDARQLRRMAQMAGASEEDMAAGIVRAWLSLVRAAPDALPNDPLRRLSARADRGIGGAP